MKRLFGVAILAGALVTALNCGGDGGTDTGPGVLQVKLVSPVANADSAIEITITGPAAPTGATAGNGLRLFQDPGASGTTRHYALTGQLTNGATILTINVADVAAFSEYHGTVDGVSRANYTLRLLNGYALALTR